VDCDGDDDGGHDQEPNHSVRAAAGRCLSLGLSFPKIRAEPRVDPNFELNACIFGFLYE